ncbi:DEAD/DEAH box helicase [Rubripirellula sp.]|nr:DEAD/DEAH box helicase [Planctomycetaceae bacterium]MDA9857819.1 DEAD/DEAH box helicase [Rubripirellula sp.]
MNPRPLEKMMKQHGSLEVQIDQTNSWCEATLIPSDTHELLLEKITPRAFPIRVPVLETKCVGFQFPQSGSWSSLKETTTAKDAKTADAEKHGTRKEKPSGLRDKAKNLRRHRIKPPNEVVKLQDRLFYLLQPPLDSLVGSGQMKFPFEPFPYQLDGIAFLFPRYAAILADEMGLGKTMQAISTIRMLICSGEAQSVLLVCPKPLVSNWIREFQVWAPEIPITTIGGPAKKREFQWRSKEFPVVIANYELLMRDRDIVNDVDTHFDLVALDEAQRIKNRNSSTSEVIRAIPRTRSWALTGTPVENSPDDLVGIFDFLSPGYLSVGMPMTAMASASQDYILRRTKDMVMEDMPPKLYRDAELDLTPEQWATYQSAESEGVIYLEQLEQALTIQHVFELVLRLKQICNFDPVTGSSVKLDRLVADMEEVAASGKKAIVFSQWVNSIDKMKDEMKRFGALEYHGRVPHNKRETVIDQFREDPDCHVILMSYGAGSVGLNLQFCEYVFLFDRWWNPAIEDQAINRAHRIGAKGAVTVTRMLAMNTIEQRIASVLDQKREMFDTLFSDKTGVARGGGLSRDEIFGLFDLRAPCGKKVA